MFLLGLYVIGNILNYRESRVTALVHAYHVLKQSEDNSTVKSNIQVVDLVLLQLFGRTSNRMPLRCQLQRHVQASYRNIRQLIT